MKKTQVLLGIVAGLVCALPAQVVQSDYIGQAWFPQGDLIEITAVGRNENLLTVAGRYNLVSHERATLRLYITTTNKNAGEGKSTPLEIARGRGDFALAYGPLVAGLPHVSMYPVQGGESFASLYFGTKEEAVEERRMKLGRESGGERGGSSPTAAPLTLESAPPVVVRTEPVAGAAQVDPRTSEIVVQFSKKMQDGGWSWTTWGEENFPEMTGQPRYLPDGRTCVLPVKLQPGKFYATWLNSDKFRNFKDVGDRAAVPYLLTFTTASAGVKTSSSIPKAESLSGKLAFHGRYQHRSRGTDIDTPSELWVSESPDGSLNVLSQFRQSSDYVSSDAAKRFTSYRSGPASGDQSGYQLSLELLDGLVKATRRGVRQDWDGKELTVPTGAWFDPNARPDSYCAANTLLRAFAVREGETKEFRVYDWDNSGEALVDYTIQVKHAGKEKVEVPAGTFEANHLVLTQVTSADTWFKKRAGHVTDFWVLDNHIIVRVLRHREPYEMVLLDYTVPAKLDTLPVAETAVVAAKTKIAAERKFVRVVLDDKHMTFEGEPATWDNLEARLSALPDRDRTVLEWAVSSTQITLQQQNDWSARFAELARKQGFAYASYVGVHPFGSKGGMPPVGQATTVAPVADEQLLLLLNDDQRAVVAWTDRQFRSYFDTRSFEGKSADERATLEAKWIEALNGPRSNDYFQAINMLGAMRSTKALSRLREIASERVDRNNRDRWMAIRALGLIGDKQAVPELIQLVYHGNVNTRWWAQISLVQITGQNFAKDWNAWGKWWNDQNGQPPFKPEIIHWWDGQAGADKLAESLEENDRKFFESLKPKSAAAPAPAASGDVAAKLRNATPLMDGIRESWSSAVQAMQRDDATSALASLRILAPRIQEFTSLMKGTALEAGAAESLETLKSLMTSLEKGDKDATQTALASMTALGQNMEQQVKAATDTPPMPAPEPVSGLANALVLKRDNGMQTGVQSIAASGHAVQFQRSGETRYEARYVEAVHFFGSRYGTPEPPQDDFNLYLLNEQQQVIADVKFPYSMIERGDPKWYTLRTPSIEVPEKFTVALNFNPHQTKGVYLAYSAISGEECFSLIGLPGDGFRFWKPVEWMVRVSLTAEPSKAKGFQALADWKPSVARSPLANCRVVSFGGDKSEGQQSYGDRGPAIRFKPVELLPGVRANAPLTLKGVRLYASRYGSGYSPEATKLHVILRGANDTVLAETDFAYAKFGYKADWVDLVFDQPVRIEHPGEPVTIAFDPEATQSKGVYFHYQKNPATSHSLAGNVSTGFKEVTDREWMVRACFE